MYIVIQSKNAKYLNQIMRLIDVMFKHKIVSVTEDGTTVELLEGGN